ncbi:MerR family transcriptional regulator [Plantactinospora sp. CA-290183]|uniref:MerR family transcriptional regulator n=1 Tax=Plantactinospora sp. CA-290183 TaxID=3240006 RepID=UPI003D8DFB5F
MADDGLSAGAVARRLGVAVTTLRTWHQRYGLGPSRHVPGQHRRYSVEDLARLEVMRRLTAEGVRPADAARWARRASAVPGAAGTAATAAGSRGRGGAVIPVRRAGPAARGLARAAGRLDPAAMRTAIARSVGSDGVVATWESLLRPVLARVGERHAATGGFVEVEHLLSRAVSEVLGTVPRPPDAGEPPRVLLACADEEQHTLPLEALAAALAEAGVPCRQLGARTPVAALVAAVRRTAPEAVVVWSHTPATGDPDQLTALLSAPRRPPLVLAAGPGWPLDALPGGVRHPATLAEAVALLGAVPEPPG